MLFVLPSKKERGPVYTRDPEGQEITEWRGACAILNQRLQEEGSSVVVDQTMIANLAAQGKIPVAWRQGHNRFYAIAFLRRMDLADFLCFKPREHFNDAVKQRAKALADEGKQPAVIARVLSQEVGRQISRQSVRVWIGGGKEAEDE